MQIYPFFSFRQTIRIQRLGQLSVIKKTAVASLLLGLTACQALPDTPHLPKSIALTQDIQAQNHQASKHATPPALNIIPLPKPQKPRNKQPLTAVIDKALIAHIAKHPNKNERSGYLPIVTGANAFAVRSILSDLTDKTIDAQYYIWHDDEAGQLMLKDLWDAAERGVKVRLLIDDMNGNANLDNLFASIAAHPNIAVRLVNPMLYRTARPINYIANPLRINRRMHNKSMTFDGTISIVGGRNIGDEYLNNSQNSHFADLDVLLIGDVVKQVENSFESYWQSAIAYDIETLTKKRGLDKKTKRLIEQDNRAKESVNQKNQILKTYRTALTDATIGKQLLSQSLPFRFKNIQFVADSPSKLAKKTDNEPHLIDKLQDQFGTPTRQLSIISSYFVPTKDGVQTLTALAKSGVKIQILTNSYDATDVGMVHSGYAHWRKTLLQAGIKLFELKATAPFDNIRQNQPKADLKDNRLWRTKQRTTTSLHAKLFAIDNQKVFIGSYNLDPRSANLNTELGVLIDDDELANGIHQAFDGTAMLAQAYEVKLNNNRLEWHTLENGTLTILHKEPNMRGLHKFSITLLSWLPIEWLL